MKNDAAEFVYSCLVC